jgi:ribosomal protein S18 acetylase RimI-like enzyme
MGVVIRPYGVEDRAAVAALLNESPAFNAEEVRVAIAMLDPADGYDVFVAEVEGVICGYTCIGPTPFTVSTWHLYWIAVHPHAQHRGVGRALQLHVEEYVRGRNGPECHERRLVVETSGRPDYEGSRRFYEASGYRVAGRIPDYYKPGDDCLFYCKVF